MRSLAVLLLVLCLFASKTNAQYEIRVVDKGNAAIGVQARCTSATHLPTSSMLVADLVLAIVWPASYNVDLSSLTSSPGYFFTRSGGLYTNGSWNFASYAATNQPYPVPVNWGINAWVDLFSVTVNQTGIGTGTFCVADSGFTNNLPIWTDPIISFDAVNWYHFAVNGCATNVPLPVELLSFSAYNQDDHVHLHWETATELNNFGFEVQRREDGAEWKTVGFVPGHGTRFYPQIYDWDDMLLDLDIPISQQRSITYRLKQVDRDGSFEYSPIVEVAFRPVTGSMVMDVYPNPAHDRAAISVMLRDTRTVDIVVYDINGRAVRRVVEGRPLESGSHAFDIDAHSLPSGIYTIRISDESGVSMKPFVVRK